MNADVTWISIADAALLIGKDPATISKAARKGTLAARQLPDGSREWKVLLDGDQRVWYRARRSAGWDNEQAVKHLAVGSAWPEWIEVHLKGPGTPTQQEDAQLQELKFQLMQQHAAHEQQIQALREQRDSEQRAQRRLDVVNQLNAVRIEQGKLSDQEQRLLIELARIDGTTPPQPDIIDVRLLPATHPGSPTSRTTDDL